MHIHIPDGVLPVWLWAGGFIIAGIALIAAMPFLRKQVKKVPLVGMMTAIALLVMSIPLGLPVHINLMILIGILVGGHWSLVVALLVNLILASFGHGGITIVGLNTILLWLQALAGIFLFKLFVKFIKNYFLSAALAVFLSLALSFGLQIGIVAASTVDPADILYHKEHVQEETENNSEQKGEEASGHEEQEFGHTQVSLLTFTILSLPVAALGILVESIVTGFVVQFIYRVKPELILKQ